jgi:hypothetical protein
LRGKTLRRGLPLLPIPLDHRQQRTALNFAPLNAKPLARAHAARGI